MSSLYNIDYLKFLCKKYGFTPSKKYGQNFLINEEPITKMLEAAELKTDDAVVEVGPGFGVLTLALAEKAKKVVAFEIEKKLTAYWNDITGHPELVSGSTDDEIPKQVRNDRPHGSIEIIWGNALNQNINLEKYKVVANLPYQITSNVIRKFLEAENKPELMVLMVQKEVAERICAKPSLPGVAGKRSRGEMSVLSVSVQYYAEPEIVMQVPRSYFWPAPAVDSAVIKLRVKQPACHSDDFKPVIPTTKEGSLSQSPTADGQRSLVVRLGGLARDDKYVNDKQFFKIVKAGFASRRKMLIKNLGSITDKKKLPGIFQELGISPKVRAQELSVEEWKALAKNVNIKNQNAK